jgi:hypothetical protein
LLLVAGREEPEGADRGIELVAQGEAGARGLEGALFEQLLALLKEGLGARGLGGSGPSARAPPVRVTARSTTAVGDQKRVNG